MKKPHTKFKYLKIEEVVSLVHSDRKTGKPETQNHNTVTLQIQLKGRRKDTYLL